MRTGKGWQLYLCKRRATVYYIIVYAQVQVYTSTFVFQGFFCGLFIHPPLTSNHPQGLCGCPMSTICRCFVMVVDWLCLVVYAVHWVGGAGAGHYPPIHLCIRLPSSNCSWFKATPFSLLWWSIPNFSISCKRVLAFTRKVYTLVCLVQCTMCMQWAGLSW